MTPALPKNDLDLIRAAIKNVPEVERAILFGSRALGSEKTGSDVDIAIMGSCITENTSNHLRIVLNEELPLPYFFDVVNYGIIDNEDLKQHIDENGIEIYHSNIAK